MAACTTDDGGQTGDGSGSVGATAGEDTTPQPPATAGSDVTSDDPSMTSSSSPTEGGDDTAASESSASSSGGEDACAEFHSSRVTGPEVTIGVSHEALARVYFEPEGCNAFLPIRIYSQASGEEMLWRADYDCLWTCDRQLDEPTCGSGGCQGCAPPDFGWIEPGVLIDEVWSGLAITLMEWSDACEPTPDCDATCWREHQTPPGTYTVELTVYRTCVGACTCDNRRSDPICTSVYADALADPVVLSATIEYPRQTEAELVVTD